MKDADNSGGRDRYVRGEDYRPYRNPQHFADSNLLRENRDINLKPYYDKNGIRSQVGQSLNSQACKEPL